MKKNWDNTAIKKTEKKYVGDDENLIAEWNWEKNGEITPTQLTLGSHVKVWWKCSEGHEWQATIKNRAKGGTNCPICSRSAGARARNNTLIKKRNSFADKHPELASEWYYEKNGDITPEIVLPKSQKLFWWKCANGHEWQATPADRTRVKGCPYCSGQRVLIGYNDLATTHPEIVKEWHPTKNGDLRPQNYSYGSHEKIWWQCIKGHEWQTSIAYRTIDRTGCPVCAKELRTSFPEQAVLFYVRKIFPDSINNERTILAGKELDIYIPSCKTAIEYDGEAWHVNEEKDAEKSNMCRMKGIRLIRIRESGCGFLEQDKDIYECKAGDWAKLSEIIRKICVELAKKEVDVNVERDNLAIQEQYVISTKEASLAGLYPDLANEWHPTKNGKLDATMFYSGSVKKVWWKCSKGHEWKAVIESRVRGSGCPYCSGRNAVKGENDLETVNPRLASEWDAKKNGILKPSDVLPNSGKKVWWKCSKGHEWQDTPSHRSANRGCPYCSGQRVLDGYNDLVTTHPKIASEWHPTKNGSLSPKEVTKGSNKKFWWKCSKGHEWQAAPNERTRGYGCPYCSGQRVLRGYNDLATTHPFLLKEWNYEKNAVLPDSISKGSHMKIWWKCSKGHEWQAQVKNRTNGTKCPYCSGKRKLK